MKIFNSKIHGIIDYAVIAFLLLSPTIFPDYPKNNKNGNGKQ